MSIGVALVSAWVVIAALILLYVGHWEGGLLLLAALFIGLKHGH